MNTNTKIVLAAIGGIALGALLFLPWRGGPGQAPRSEMMTQHFLQQMIPHHEVAVDMADRAIAEAEHSELRELAVKMRGEQQAEIDHMRSWLKDWYRLESGWEIRMGMGMMNSQHDDVMGRLATSDPFDKQFIEEMIPHHQMAVMMAQMVLRNAERPEIRRLANDIIRAQSEEIRQMRAWYADWYGETTN